jgi:Fic family protein
MDKKSRVGHYLELKFVLPDTSLFLYMYIRKEAVLSSQIEGTQSSLVGIGEFRCSEGNYGQIAT